MVYDIEYFFEYFVLEQVVFCYCIVVDKFEDFGFMMENFIEDVVFDFIGFEFLCFEGFEQICGFYVQVFVDVFYYMYVFFNFCVVKLEDNFVQIYCYIVGMG